jgi:DNA uptake protein ComE-like DNA-binding protein
VNKKPVRLISAVVLALACSAWSSAQENESPAPKKPASKALQEAKAKAREKRNDAKAKADAEAKAKAVDINHASLEELKKVPGLTDADAAAILKNRPYKSKADLVAKKVIPMGTYQSVRKLVAAN